MSKPKLALIPSGYKSGTVYSILPNDATGDFDFTRQSIGTRVRKDGLIEEAKTVGSITNELLYSEEFTGLNWANVNTTITADQELAPNGTNTADKIARTSTSASYTAHTISKSSTAKKFTTSVYLKKGSHDYFALRTQGSYPSRVDVRFRFDTEQIYYAQAISNFTLYDYGVEVLANDWYRLHYTYETDTHSNISVSFSPRSTDGNIDNTDTSSTAHAFVWGAMVSEGALSDYIKTEGTTETKTVETFTDVPRLDWLNSNCPSLLLEPQRSNLFAYSEDTSQWASIRGTTTSNNIIAPNGELVGSLYEKTEDANEGYVYRNLTVSSVGTYSVSLFFKYNNSQYAHFLLFDGSSNGARAWFDIQNGVVGTSTTFGSTFTVSDLSIKNYGNGWYKCSAKYVVTGTDTTWQFRVSPSGSNGVTNSDSGAKIYFFGAQIEQGSYPTSYIKTEASAVTRLKDECLNGGDSDLFNITEGTFFVDTTPFTYEAIERITLSNNSYNNRILISKANASQLQFIIVSNNITVATTTQNINYNQRNKIAFTFKENEFKFYLNGSLVHTDTSGSVPNGLNDLSFKGIGSALYWNGKIHDTRVYDRVLTEAEAIEITTL